MGESEENVVYVPGLRGLLRQSLSGRVGWVGGPPYTTTDHRSLPGIDPGGLHPTTPGVNVNRLPSCGTKPCLSDVTGGAGGVGGPSELFPFQDVSPSSSLYYWASLSYTPTKDANLE